MAVPHGTDGNDAEKFGNLEGFGGGLTGNSFAEPSFWPMDEVRVFLSCVSASPTLPPAMEDFLGGSGGSAAFDGARARATGTAVASWAV